MSHEVHSGLSDQENFTECKTLLNLPDFLNVFLSFCALTQSLRQILRKMFHLFTV